VGFMPPFGRLAVAAAAVRHRKEKGWESNALYEL